MGIFKKDRVITSLSFGDIAFTAVYKGTKLIWEAIRSCFGKGFWINSYPWGDKDSWQNNS